MLSTNRLNICALPAFTDNYIWLIESKGSAIVVDPGDAQVVETALRKLSLKLNTILITHHHQDHIGGLYTLHQHHQCEIFAPKHSAINLPHTAVDDYHPPDFSQYGLDCTLLSLPGHTLDHVGYLLNDVNTQDSHLFCGDVLFSAGCGRLFEGTPAQMYQSLQRISQLTPHTLLYPAHEYTLQNIAFAKEFEPNNPSLMHYEQQCLALRQNNVPTLPTKLSNELAINPFLRTQYIAPKIGMAQNTTLEVFTYLRKQRDVF